MIAQAISGVEECFTDLIREWACCCAPNKPRAACRRAAKHCHLVPEVPHHE